MNTLTKIFVVLQLVLALVLAVVVVVFAYKQGNYRHAVAVQQKARIAAAAALALAETQNADLQRRLIATEKAATAQAGRLQSQLLALQAKRAADQTRLARLEAQAGQSRTNVALLTNTVHSLNAQVAAATSQLNALRPEVLKYINENAQLNRRIYEVTDDSNIEKKTIQTLQENIAALNHRLRLSAARPTQRQAALGAALAGVYTPVLVNGRVRHVRHFQGRIYVSTTLGTRDGVRKGTRLVVYQDHRYIGDILVQNVDATESVGVVTLHAPGAVINNHDLVMSGPGL